MSGKLLRILLCLLTLAGPALALAQAAPPAAEPICAMAQPAPACCCSGPQAQQCPCSVDTDPGPQTLDWLPFPGGPAQPLLARTAFLGPAALPIAGRDQGFAPPAWHPPQPIYLRFATLLI